jgi:hypothetical protein
LSLFLAPFRDLGRREAALQHVELVEAEVDYGHLLQERPVAR